MKWKNRKQGRLPIISFENEWTKIGAQKALYFKCDDLEVGHIIKTNNLLGFWKPSYIAYDVNGKMITRSTSLKKVKARITAERTSLVRMAEALEIESSFKQSEFKLDRKAQSLKKKEQEIQERIREYNATRQTAPKPKPERKRE